MWLEAHTACDGDRDAMWEWLEMKYLRSEDRREDLESVLGTVDSWFREQKYITDRVSAALNDG